MVGLARLMHCLHVGAASGAVRAVGKEPMDLGVVVIAPERFVPVVIADRDSMVGGRGEVIDAIIVVVSCR